MTLRTVFIVMIFCFSPLLVSASGAIAASQAPPSFFQLVGETDWQVSLKDFAVSTVEDGKFFSLRVGENRYLSFSAHPENGDKATRFGPLLTAYAPTLAGLLDYARHFGELEKSGFSTNVDWELYPDSIRNWALVWKDSDLKKKWKGMEQHKRYTKLMDMIAGQVKKDMQPLARTLGFEATGASMEKMTFQEVGKLPFFQKMLKPAGISADLKLPMPLILSLKIKPLNNTAVSLPENTNPVAVDSLFASAKSSSASLYCSFLRELDEYEISGDRLNPDGTYIRLLPLSQKEYHPMAAQLLNASLRATKGNERTSFALRLNLDLYPEVYRKVVKQFTFSPQQAKKNKVPRPQLPKLEFSALKPSPASGFATAVNSFLKPNGYEFRHLLVSVESRRKAESFPAYAKIFMPLGIGPQERPKVPDIVYLIAGKYQE